MQELVTQQRGQPCCEQDSILSGCCCSDPPASVQQLDWTETTKRRTTSLPYFLWKVLCHQKEGRSFGSPYSGSELWPLQRPCWCACHHLLHSHWLPERCLRLPTGCQVGKKCCLQIIKKYSVTVVQWCSLEAQWWVSLHALLNRKETIKKMKTAPLHTKQKHPTLGHVWI